MYYYCDRKEYDKKNIENNKEKIALQNKEYRENNKEKINKKYHCQCGGKYSHNNKALHLKTKKHQKYLLQ